MSDFTLNGLPVPRGRIVRQLVGCWHADLEVAADRVNAGPAVLMAGDLQLSGWVINAGEYYGRAPVYMIGSRAGGFLRRIPGRSYTLGVPLFAPISDILREIGEQIDSAAPLAPELAAIRLASYTRIGDTAEACLSVLLRHKAAWRTTDRGDVSILVDRWPAHTGQLYLISYAPNHQSAQYAIDDLSLYPGTTIDGNKVSSVEYIWDSDMLRVNVTFQSKGATETAERAAFFALVREACPELQSLPWRAATVRSVRAPDGAAEVHFDDPGVADQAVRLLAPSPGGKVKAETGDRVHVAFADAELTQPIGALYEPSALAKPVALVSDNPLEFEVDCGTLVTMGGLVVAVYPPGTPEAAKLPPVTTGPPPVVHYPLFGKYKLAARSLAAR